MLVSANYIYKKSEALEQATERCHHCNRPIKSLIYVESDDGGIHIIGNECAEELLGMDKSDLRHIKLVEREAMAVIKNAQKSKINPTITEYSQGKFYAGFRVVIGNWSGNYPIDFLPNFLHFLKINKIKIENEKDFFSLSAPFPDSGLM